jgi:hypothetical protein
MYCLYYQARLVKEMTWFVVGALRAEHSFVFERSVNPQDPQLFEFFVPAEHKEEFLTFMDCMIRRGHVVNLERKPNRLQPQN